MDPLQIAMNYIIMHTDIIPAATFSVLIIFAEDKFLLCFSVNRNRIKIGWSLWLNTD